MFQAAVHHGATAEAMSKLFDRLLRLGTGGEGAVPKPVLRDVGALSRLKLGIGLISTCNPGLQHTTRSQHAGHRLLSPFAKHGCTEGWIIIARIHAPFHYLHKFVFTSNCECYTRCARDDVQSLEHKRLHTPLLRDWPPRKLHEVQASEHGIKESGVSHRGRSSAGGGTGLFFTFLIAAFS